MRYLMAAKVRPGRQEALLQALEDGRFGRGFPYGNLGDVLTKGRVDPSGTVRWVEVCYCREYLGVAMVEELPYFEEYLTEMTITDARSPEHCEGYPACSSCDCTKKVRPKGEPLLDFLRRTVAGDGCVLPTEESPTRWLGWRGRVSPEEARRNRAGAVE